MTQTTQPFGAPLTRQGGARVVVGDGPEGREEAHRLHWEVRRVVLGAPAHVKLHTVLAHALACGRRRCGDLRRSSPKEPCHALWQEAAGALAAEVDDREHLVDGARVDETVGVGRDDVDGVRVAVAAGREDALVEVVRAVSAISEVRDELHDVWDRPEWRLDALGGKAEEERSDGAGVVGLDGEDGRRGREGGYRTTRAVSGAMENEWSP